MKKGFTIAEIIIVITLILIIGISATMFITKKNKNNTNEEKFLKELSVVSNVYLDGIKLDSNRKQISKPGDFITVKISELISRGLIKEETHNPITNTLLKENSEECIKIFMNDEYEIKIEYPSECYEDIPIIVLNGSEEEEWILEDSYEIYYIKNNVDSQIMSKIINGQYTNWLDAGIGLKKSTGETIEIVPDDWERKSVWTECATGGKDCGDKIAGYWTYTYLIKEEGPTDIPNRDKIEPVTRKVKLKDNSAPILISNKTKTEYVNDQFMFHRNSNLELEENWASFDVTYDYYIFDNYVAPIGTLGFYLENQLIFREFTNLRAGQSDYTIRLEDFVGNDRTYTLNMYMINNCPYAKYNGPTIIYTDGWESFVDEDVKQHIFYDDIDKSDSVEMSYTFIEKGSTINTYNGTAGYYYLNITVKDGHCEDGISIIVCRNVCLYEDWNSNGYIDGINETSCYCS